MKRTVTFVTVCLLVLGTAALAQEAPKAEVFGGYQLTRASSGVSGVSDFNLSGWDASVSGYFNHYLGVTSDFSGTYGTPFGVSTHLYTYMFGPVVRAANNNRLQPFGHVLFGGAHISGTASSGGVTASASDSGFSWAAGGGLDYKAMPMLGIRLGQFDFVQTHISGDSQNNFRYSGGIVIRF